MLVDTRIFQIIGRGAADGARKTREVVQTGYETLEIRKLTIREFKREGKDLNPMLQVTREELEEIL